MHTSRKLLLAGCGLLALTAAASRASAAGNTAGTSAAASVSVFSPFSVVKETDLLFGRVIRPSSGNTTTYTVNETTGATSTSGGDGTFTGGGSTGRALFTVYGTGGAGFTISTDSTVVASGVTINLVKSAASGTLGAGATGTATFGVGGNIVLTDTAPTGSHSGVFTVTVDYP